MINFRQLFTFSTIAILSLILTESTAIKYPRIITGADIEVEQEVRMCRRDPSIPWCRAHTPCEGRRCEDDIQGAARGADRDSRRGFTYRDNPGNLTPSTQQWRSHSREVNAGISWTGECDQMMATVLEIAIQRGIPSNRVWRAVTMLQGEQYDNYSANHAVGLIKDQNGTVWVVGDINSDGMYVLTSRVHIVYISRADRGLSWEKYYGPEQLR
jgi:hypothetical protein